MVKSQSYKEVAYHYLKEHIDNNILLPDTHLKEVEIAETLDMSRTPVRKAMNQLAEEGYIKIEPYKGAVVAKSALNSRAIVERLQFIEILVMNLFQQMQNKDVYINIEELDHIMDNLLSDLDKGDIDGYFKWEFEMYTHLASYHPNSYFRQVALNTIVTLQELFNKEIKASRTKFERERDDLLRIYPEMVGALKKGDYANARKQVRIFINQLILYQING